MDNEKKEIELEEKKEDSKEKVMTSEFSLEDLIEIDDAMNDEE